MRQSFQNKVKVGFKMKISCLDRTAIGKIKAGVNCFYKNAIESGGFNIHWAINMPTIINSDLSNWECQYL